MPERRLDNIIDPFCKSIGLSPKEQADRWNNIPKVIKEAFEHDVEHQMHLLDMILTLETRLSQDLNTQKQSFGSQIEREKKEIGNSMTKQVAQIETQVQKHVIELTEDGIMRSRDINSLV